jgi:hypothetical protein
MVAPLVVLSDYLLGDRSDCVMNGYDVVAGRKEALSWTEDGFCGFRVFFSPTFRDEIGGRGVSHFLFQA